MEDIEIQVWDKEKKTRWRELLPAWYNFWVNEPLNSAAIGDIEEGDTKLGLDQLMHDQVHFSDIPVIAAYDSKNQKVAGFVYSIAEYAEEPTSEEMQKQDQNDDGIKVQFNFRKYPFSEEKVLKMEAIGSFLDQLAANSDVCQKYNVDKVWVIQITSVCPEYTRRGLANQMTAKVLETAKERGFQLIMSESTSQFTQRNKIKTFQFENILEVSLQENYLNYSDMPEEMKKMHPTAAVLVKRL